MGKPVAGEVVVFPFPETDLQAAGARAGRRGPGELADLRSTLNPAR